MLPMHVEPSPEKESPFLRNTRGLSPTCCACLWLWLWLCALQVGATLFDALTVALRVLAANAALCAGLILFEPSNSNLKQERCREVTTLGALATARLVQPLCTDTPCGARQRMAAKSLRCGRHRLRQHGGGHRLPIAWFS